MSTQQALITDKAELTKAIDTWGKQGQKWAKQGHLLAMSALTVLESSGDVGPVNRLYLAMPKGTKSSAMAEWLLAFGKLRPNDGDNAKTMPFAYDKARVNDLESANKKPWFEFKPEPSVLEVFDVVAAAQAFLKSARSKAAAAQSATGLTLLDEIAALIPEAPEGQDDSTADPLVRDTETATVTG